MVLKLRHYNFSTSLWYDETKLHVLFQKRHVARGRSETRGLHVIKSTNRGKKSWQTDRKIFRNGLTEFNEGMSFKCKQFISNHWKAVTQLIQWLATGRTTFDSRQGRAFLSSARPDRLWSPPNLITTSVSSALSPGVKLAERETDHSPPTSAVGRNVLNCTSIFACVFMAWCFGTETTLNLLYLCTKDDARL